MKIFRDIDIRKEETPLAFLIQEALLEKAPFEKSGQNLLSITPTIKNSYGIITTENEITRYSVTLDVEYSLYNKETKEIILKNNVSATSDYSAAVTFTGFATEIAREIHMKDWRIPLPRKMITEILINNQIKYSLIYSGTTFNSFNDHWELFCHSSTY